VVTETMVCFQGEPVLIYRTGRQTRVTGYGLGGRYTQGLIRLEDEMSKIHQRPLDLTPLLTLWPSYIAIRDLRSSNMQRFI
jgi:hypothetical protein